MKKKIANLIRQRNEGKSLKEPPPPPKPIAERPELSHEFLLTRMKLKMENSELEQCLQDVREGRVYTIEHFTKMLRCSKETARLMFAKEPGVVRLRHGYRIPETVMVKVLNRMLRGDRK